MEVARCVGEAKFQDEQSAGLAQGMQVALSVWRLGRLLWAGRKSRNPQLSLVLVTGVASAGNHHRCLPPLAPHSHVDSAVTLAFPGPIASCLRRIFRWLVERIIARGSDDILLLTHVCVQCAERCAVDPFAIAAG
jgi:hypothetical protein